MNENKVLLNPGNTEGTGARASADGLSKMTASAFRKENVLPYEPSALNEIGSPVSYQRQWTYHTGDA